jgi:phage virion morphogenesis protein
MIKVTNLDKVSKKLQELEKNANNLRPCMENIAVILEENIQNNFDNESEATGKKWKRLKKKTIKYKNKRGYKKKLQNKGILASSITSDISDKSVEVGSNLSYASVHQYGSEKKNIPARAFLPIDSGGNIPKYLEDDIIDEIDWWL